MAPRPCQVRALVAGHWPTSPREVAAKERFLAELDRLDDPYDEHADPMHVTASAIVVGTRGTVLHLHKRLGRWMQPGGHIDPGRGAARGRPARGHRGARPGRGASRGGPRLIHLDVHEAALGHTHLDLRYLLFGVGGRPAPAARARAPRRAGMSWDEAAAIADEALAPALVGGPGAEWERWSA